MQTGPGEPLVGCARPTRYRSHLTTSEDSTTEMILDSRRRTPTGGDDVTHSIQPHPRTETPASTRGGRQRG